MNSDEILNRILEHKRNKPLTKKQKELKSIFSGVPYNKTNLEILDIDNEGIITLKRNRKTYKIKKVDRQPKRWDFIFFNEDDYQGSWFKENCGNFFLVKKSDGPDYNSYIYFDDLNGFDCYLHTKYTETYEVIDKW